MSSDSARPKNVHFVDVTAKEPRQPGWIRARGDEPPPAAGEYRVSPLMPEEVASHARPALAPVLDSVRPPPLPRPPSQFPSASRPPSQFPGPVSARPSQYPGPYSRPPSQFPGAQDSSNGADTGVASGVRERRRDTLIEALVPRAEEEAVAAIRAAVEQFAVERAQALVLAETELVELVKVICKRVVLRELNSSTAVVEGLIQEGLEALGRGDRVTVKLGPFFADVLEHISENLRHKGIDCVVVIDPGVGSYGCLLETELGRVDESVETRLDVLLRSLDGAA